MFDRDDYLRLLAYDKANARSAGRAPEPGQTVKLAEERLIEAIKAGRPCPDGVPADWYQRQVERYTAQSA